MDVMMLSPETEHQMYTHHLGVSHPNIEDMMGHGQSNLPIPPSYEESVMQAKMHQAQSMASGLANSQQQQAYESQFMQHPRQQSIPASMTYNPHMSPPDPTHGLMSPPQSVQSQHSLSPPGPITSTHSTSPVKPRGILPTSPTHMAAMRNHQRHQSFEFPDSSQQMVVNHPGMMQQNMFPYTNLPTPPQQNVQENSSYMTPSPESPWSSSSPQSQDCWSDGIHSPPGNFQQTKQKQQQDGIFI